MLPTLITDIFGFLNGMIKHLKLVNSVWKCFVRLYCREIMSAKRAGPGAHSWSLIHCQDITLLKTSFYCNLEY